MFGPLKHKIMWFGSTVSLIKKKTDNLLCFLRVVDCRDTSSFIGSRFFVVVLRMENVLDRTFLNSEGAKPMSGTTLALPSSKSSSCTESSKRSRKKSPRRVKRLKRLNSKRRSASAKRFPRNLLFLF